MEIYSFFWNSRSKTFIWYREIHGNCALVSGKNHYLFKFFRQKLFSSDSKKLLGPKNAWATWNSRNFSIRKKLRRTVENRKLNFFGWIPNSFNKIAFVTLLMVFRTFLLFWQWFRLFVSFFEGCLCTLGRWTHADLGINFILKLLISYFI